jgi:hypothetical protein
MIAYYAHCQAVSAVMRRTLDLDQTREYLREVGQR